MYIYNDDEAKPRTFHTADGAPLSWRIRPENIIKVVFRSDEEDRCRRLCVVLNEAKLQPAVHPWAQQLHLRFTVSTCTMPSSPHTLLFIYCTVVSLMLGPVVQVLIPNDASSMVAVLHVSAVLTREVFAPRGALGAMRVLSALQMEHHLWTDLHSDREKAVFAKHVRAVDPALCHYEMPAAPTAPALRAPEMAAVFEMPVDRGAPVSNANPCIGNLLLMLFHAKARNRYRARIAQYSQINSLIMPQDDGRISREQLAYLASLKCTGTNSIFLPKTGIRQVPDINVLSTMVQSVRMPPAPAKDEMALFARSTGVVKRAPEEWPVEPVKRPKPNPDPLPEEAPPSPEPEPPPIDSTNAAAASEDTPIGADDEECFNDFDDNPLSMYHAFGNYDEA